MINAMRVIYLLVSLSLIKFSFEYSLQQASCPSGYVACENGENYESYKYGDKCIKEEKVCDDNFHCTDGSDEKYCPNNFNYRRNGFVIKFVTGGCDKYSKMCLSGKVQKHYTNHYPNKRCFNNWWFCQSMSVCNDESDRMYCPYDTTLGLFQYQFSQFGCESNFYKCKEGRVKHITSLANGYCVHKSLICDGFPDCSDKSDEKYCPYVFNYKTKEINLKPFNANEQTTFTEPSTLDTTFSSGISTETTMSLESSTDLITEILSSEKTTQSDTSIDEESTSPSQHTKNILNDFKYTSKSIESDLKRKQTTSNSKTTKGIATMNLDKQKAIAREPSLYYLTVNSYVILTSQIIIIILLAYKFFYRYHSNRKIDRNEYNLTSMM